VYICIYIYRQTDRQEDRQAGQTDNQTHRKNVIIPSHGKGTNFNFGISYRYKPLMRITVFETNSNFISPLPMEMREFPFHEMSKSIHQWETYVSSHFEKIH
jgi:hypothetical protein